jgi:L-asparagine oxygenase
MGAEKTAVTAATSELAPGMLVLSTQERQTVAALAEEVNASPSEDAEQFCRQARAAAAALPERLARVLDRFEEVGSANGILVLRGLTVGELPATPPNNTHHLGERTLVAREQAVVNHRLGEMIAYEAEGHGRLFQDMVPNAASARSQTSLGSGVELEFHTEQAFSPMKPDYVSLACLRGDPQARTYVLSARRLISLLGQAERERLREPLWTTGVDESFRAHGGSFVAGDVRGPMPILEGALDDPLIVLDQDLMRGTSPEAQDLLNEVIRLYPAHRDTHVLEPGDILLLDNLRAVHGRSPFAARFDGRDRWIARTFVVRDLLRSADARQGGGRVVAAQFS